MDKMLRSVLEQVQGIENKFVTGSVEEYENQRKRKEKEKNIDTSKNKHHSKHLTEEQIEALNLPDMKVEQVTKDAKNLY